MLRTTFVMPASGSAAVRTGAAVLPLTLDSRVTIGWRDEEGGTTYLEVRHPQEDAEHITAVVLSAHPRVRLVSSAPA